MIAGPPAISQTARLFAEADRICSAGNAYGCCDRAGFTFSGSRLGSGQHPSGLPVTRAEYRLADYIYIVRRLYFSPSTT